MSLFGDYIMEREGKQIIESDAGFMTFKIFGDECYIEDMYVRKDARRLGVASDMAKEIEKKAREAGCKFVTGTCVPSTNGATESMKGMFSYGFRIHSCVEDKIILIKEL